MVFTFDVHFSGLCHYVLNSDRAASKRLCLVLPEAPGHAARISPLVGRIINATGGEVPEVKIGRSRLEWMFEENDPTKNEFGFQDELDGYYGAVPFSKLAPIIADANVRIVGATRANGVLAQIFISRGSLFPNERSTGLQWRLPGSSASAELKIKIRHETLWVLDDLKGARLLVRRFNGTIVGDYRFEPANGMVSLSLSNDCKPKEKGMIDEDFIYHYNMLDEGHFKTLKEEQFFFPLPERSPGNAFLDAVRALRKKPNRSAAESNELEILEIKLNRYSSNPSGGCNCLSCLGMERRIP